MENNMDAELKNSFLKTGTTIVGIVCKDGVVMASDRQSTAGNIVMNKNSEKTKRVNDYLLVSGTGMVSDIQRIEKVLPAELKLKELRSKTRPSIKQAANLLANMLYSGIRQPSMIPTQMGSLVGGFNEDGTCELYSVEPAGSVVKVEDFDANFGSGMPYVLGLLERQYKKGLSVEDGVKLAVECIKSSTQRDIGSGFGIDVFTITKSGIKKVVSQEILANYKEE
jgi:proteasome beta subunit